MIIALAAYTWLYTSIATCAPRRSFSFVQFFFNFEFIKMQFYLHLFVNDTNIKITAKKPLYDVNANKFFLSRLNESQDNQHSYNKKRVFLFVFFLSVVVCSSLLIICGVLAAINCCAL